MMQFTIMAGSIVSDALGVVNEVTSATLGDSISSWISDGLQWVLNNTIFRLLYWIAAAFCWLIGILYDMFEVMAGLVKVNYDGDKNYLINIFFANSSVTRVYWGMAMIGFALCFAFTIIAVVKKMFDIEGKMQQSLGVIVGNCVKSILMICLMSAFMTALLNMSNVLIQQVMYVFNNSEDLGKPQKITYTDEEYAAMARVLSTIGNYSLNPSWTSRYNINSCFNDFREDLQWLYDQDVFDVYYDEDIIGQVCWQSELQRIVYTVDLTQDQPLDVYNENLTLAIEHTVEVMQTNRNFVPISNYERKSLTSSGAIPLDRVLFLSSTMRAANNEAYNKNASFSDALRGPYYTGEKSIYDFDTVSADFNIGMATDYILLFLVGWIMIKDLAEIIFTCVSRIFNMILLYLISPPLIAATPLDGGNKLRQWITAMVVQSFGVFGTIISMRIMMLLIPVMLSDKLVLFSNVFLNILGKVILILGALEVEKKAQGLITGILADNAGMQAISAGDMKETAGRFLGGAASAGLGAMKMGYDAVKGTAKAGFGAAKLGGKGTMAAGRGAMAVGRGLANAGGWAVKKVGNMFSRDSGAAGGNSGGSGVKNLSSMDSSGMEGGIEMQDLSSKVPDMGTKDMGVPGDIAGGGPSNISGAGAFGGGPGNIGGAGGNPVKAAAQSEKAPDTAKESSGNTGSGAGAEPKKVAGSGAGKDAGAVGSKTGANANSTGGNGNNGKPAGAKKAKQKYDPLSNPGPNNEAMKFSGKGSPVSEMKLQSGSETPNPKKVDEPTIKDNSNNVDSGSGQTQPASSSAATSSASSSAATSSASPSPAASSTSASPAASSASPSPATPSASTESAGTGATATMSTPRRTAGGSNNGRMPGKKVTDGSDPLSQMSRRPSKVPPVIHRDQK